MSTRTPRAVRFRFLAVAPLALATLLILPSPVGAITFDEWASGRWPGDIAPGYVDAGGGSIHSLAGIENYDWTTTPTTR